MTEAIYWPFSTWKLSDFPEGWEGWIHIDELINHNYRLYANGLASVHGEGSQLSGQIVRIKKLKDGISCHVFGATSRPRDCEVVEFTDSRLKLPLIPVIEFEIVTDFR